MCVGIYEWPCSAMVARLTSDQSVGGSIPRAVIYFLPFFYKHYRKATTSNVTKIKYFGPKNNCYDALSLKKF